MTDVRDECGVAAIYHLPGRGRSPLCPEQGPGEISRLMPRMLLDIQNRGQLSAGMTTFNPDRNQLIDTYKDLGARQRGLSPQPSRQVESLMREYRRPGGHRPRPLCHLRRRRPQLRPAVRAAPRPEAQVVQLRLQRPVGQLPELREKLLADGDNHLARETDTEIIMHEIRPRAVGRPAAVAGRHDAGNWPRPFDGAYSLVFLNALGDMLVARDPLGIKPLCYALEGPLFAAASESVALLNLGFPPESIKSLCPARRSRSSTAGFEVQRFATSPAPGALFLRVDLFRQRGQHDGRPQRLSVAQGAWAKSWPGWRRCRSTRTRSSSPCPTPARRRPTPWPTS